MRYVGLTIAVSLFAVPASAGVGEWRTEECRYQSVDRPTWTGREEWLTARCVAEKFDPPGGLAKVLDVGDCESGWWRFARNGDYLGLFQHARSYWSSRVRAFSPRGWDLNPRWTNARTQIVVTARMAASSGSWSAWAGCA